MKKYLLSFTLIFLSIAALAQPAADIKSKFVGKWLVVKHLYTEKGKTSDFLTSNEIYTYNFASNGTYESSFINKEHASTTVYKGKWQVVGGGKKLRLYDVHLTDDPKRLISDQLFPIVSISSTQFVIKEFLFGMDLLGASYYKKQ